MNARREAIVAQLKALIEARKAAIRVRIIDRAFAQLAAAFVLVACCATVEARTITKPIGFWVKQGNQTAVVLYPYQPVRQNVTVYQTNVIRQTCKPAAKPAKPAYQPSRFTPPN
jgi:hypothetical protein